MRKPKPPKNMPITLPLAAKKYEEHPYTCSICGTHENEPGTPCKKCFPTIEKCPHCNHPTSQHNKVSENQMWLECIECINENKKKKEVCSLQNPKWWEQ